VAVVVILAVAGFFVFIRASHVDRKLLGNLVVHQTSIHGLKPRPKLASSIALSTSSFKIVKQSTKTDPDATGIYEIEWTSSTKADLDAGILLQLLPDPASAHKALIDSEKQFGTKPQLSGETVSAGTAFSVPGVPAAHADSYAMKASATGKSSGYAYTVVFQQGRAVATELVESSDTKRSVEGAASLAHAEDALLVRAGPGFSMLRTTTPVVASVVFIAIALMIAVGAFFVPEWALEAWARRRAHQEAKARERARSQFQARGRRAVRRHRAPAWRQPGRR
jgi:hypothetical protein